MKCDGGVCIVFDVPFICVENLSVSYASRPALEALSLNVPSCSITAIIGPSGCGKSSLLACLNRLTDDVPGSRVGGRIRIGELEVLDPKTDVLALRRRVGMVFQKPTPFPLSIWKNMALTLAQHGIKDRALVAETIEGALRDVGLWHEVKDRLGTSALALSGGQQQRLCIARAIALKPDVILLDEPCSALDPIASGVVEAHIKELRRRFTVVIVTHNLAQARRVSDLTALLWTTDGVGRLVEHGPTAQLFSGPRHPITSAYLEGRHG